MSEYEHQSVSGSIILTDDADKMRVTTMIWAWQRKRFENDGWTLDGGIWPRLRMTRPMRPMRLTDYIYSQTSALQTMFDKPLHSDGSYGGVDRATNPWRTNHRSPNT